jgi:hypothetical protein
VVLWERSRVRPITLDNIAQAVVILAFACAMPILLFPAVVVLLVAFLDRLGLTLLGATLVLLVLSGILWLVLFHPFGQRLLGWR